MIYEAIKKYKIDQQKTPLFLFGRSFGGLIATNMVSTPIGQAMFTGMCLLTPYYRLWTEKLYTHQRLIKLYRFISPFKLIPCEFKDLEPEYEKKWGHLERDPKFLPFFTPTVGVLWVEEQAAAKEAI